MAPSPARSANVLACSARRTAACFFLDEIGELGADEQAKLDLFDCAQLACVIRVCRASATLSEAGRRLFAVTRGNRKVTNDADRLRKYFARFGLTWAACAGSKSSAGEVS